MTDIRSSTTYNMTMTSSSANDGSSSPAINPKTSADFAQHMQQLLQQLQDKFQSTSGEIFNRIDETGRSLEELEKTIAELMTEAGIDQ